MTGEIFTRGKINEGLWWLWKSDAHGPPDAIHAAHITRGHLTSHLCQLLSHLLSCRQKIKVAQTNYTRLRIVWVVEENQNWFYMTDVVVVSQGCFFFILFYFCFAWTSSQSGWTRGEWSVVKCTAVEQKDKGCHVPDRVLTKFHLFDTRGQQANHVWRLLGTQTFLLCFLQVSQELCSLIQFLLDFQGVCNGQQTCSFMSPLGSTSTCTENIVDFFLNPAVNSSGLLLF